MIKKVSITNFFSFGYKTQEVYLNSDTNVLIGINTQKKLLSLPKNYTLCWAGILMKRKEVYGKRKNTKN